MTEPAVLRRILFVDDEQALLDALRNVLRRHRRQWTMVFVSSGEQALDALRQAPFDVVVSDMRMPGMDGAALLEQVKALHPDVARIVLSGHAERDAIARALPVAHQFLAKPCDSAYLSEVIERTCSLTQVLDSAAIRRVLGKVDNLPSPPSIYLQLTLAMQSPDTAIGEIARIVESDPAMSAKVLQLVNASFFGLTRRITSIQQAVTYLGIECLKGLSLMAHIFSTFEGRCVDSISVEDIQRRSLLTARISKRLIHDRQRSEEAFTTGLVHDIGSVVLAVTLPAEFARIARVSRETHRPFHVVERELLEVSHAQVGAYLMGMWGLPFSIVEAIAHHHDPSCVTSASRDVLAAVHVADAMVDAMHDGEERLDCQIDASFVEGAGLDSCRSEWPIIAREEFAAARRS